MQLSFFINLFGDSKEQIFYFRIIKCIILLDVETILLYSIDY